MSSVTRIFRRRAEVLGNPAPNEATGMMENPLLQADTINSASPLDVRAQFIDRWAVIKKSLEHHRHHGVLVLAFDE